MEFLIVLGAILWIIFCVWLAFTIASEFESIAIKKGYTEKKYFWYCFLLGMIGYLIVIGLVPKNGVTADSVKDDVPEI